MQVTTLLLHQHWVTEALAHCKLTFSCNAPPPRLPPGVVLLPVPSPDLVEVGVQVTTLLLHQHRVTEALAQLQRHVELFRRPPPGVPPGYAAWHFSWVTRQYKVVGELLGGRVNPANLPPQVLLPIMKRQTATSDERSIPLGLTPISHCSMGSLPLSDPLIAHDPPSKDTSYWQLGSASTHPNLPPHFSHVLLNGKIGDTLMAPKFLRCHRG